MELLEAEYLDNSVLQWLIALGIVVLVWAVLYALERLALWRIPKLAERTATRWDDLLVQALKRTKPLFLLILSLYAASLVLDLPEHIRGGLQAVVKVAVVVQAGFWLSAGVRAWLDDYRKRKLKDDPSAVTSMMALAFIAQLVLWLLVGLLVLSNAGVEVAPLVASLGVGGIAVALAVQNILGDLFASLSIVLDKPFVVGDFLILGDFLGSVEYIGLKTTRLRSLSGEQLVFSNSDLLNSRIRNYGRMFERRVVFQVGVVYSTPKEKLEWIPKRIREVVEGLEKTRFDRSHFKGYGESSLDFETVYYVLAPEYNLYMDIQQRINLALYESFQREGIDFAFPTRTLHVVRGGEPEGDGVDALAGRRGGPPDSGGGERQP